MMRNFLNRHQRAYSAMVRTVIEPIHSYWRDHNDQKLGSALHALRVLVDGQELNEHYEPTSVTVRIEGWIPPLRHFRLSVRDLRRHNPEYRVRLRTFRRDDARLPWWLSWWRTGYVVRAEGGVSLPPFAFGMSGPAGDLFSMPASNSDAVYGASYLATVAEAIPDARASGAQWGYVDSIMFFGHADRPSRQNWLAALASFHPNEMLELADSPEGDFLAKPVAAILDYHPGNSRLSDQFSLIIGIAERDLHSDSIALRVNRVARPKLFSGITIPEFERHGAVASAKRGFKPMPSPSDEWLHLENATVQDGGTVIVGDELIVYEVAADPSLDFVAGHYGSIRGSKSNPGKVLVEKRPMAEQSIAEGILLAGRNDSNWYHWLIEYLPRVMQATGVIAKSVPVIVTSRTPQSGIDALRFFTDRRIVVVDADTSVSVGLLHFVAPVVQVLDTTRVGWSAGILLNPQPLRAMRSMLRVGAGDGTRKIFLQRSSRHRRMGNARKIEAVARMHGLEIVDPGNLTWDEQRILFSDARLVVGASGAVMANYLFMPAGSRVLAMTSETLDGFVLPAVIAELAGVKFSYLLGKPSLGLDHFKHRRDWFHGNFEVNPKEFDTALRHELRQLD